MKKIMSRLKRKEKQNRRRCPNQLKRDQKKKAKMYSPITRKKKK